MLEFSSENGLKYMLKVFVDDYILLTVRTLQEQMVHIDNVVMHGIHDVFPPDADKEDDQTSFKKPRKLEVVWVLKKGILGF